MTQPTVRALVGDASRLNGRWYGGRRQRLGTLRGRWAAAVVQRTATNDGGAAEQRARTGTVQQTAARAGTTRRTVRRTVRAGKDGRAKVSCYKGCVKKKGNKNTARARSAPTYTKSRRPARRLSHLAAHQRTVQTLLHATAPPRTHSPTRNIPRRAFYVISHYPTRNLSCRVSTSLRTACLAPFPLDPSLSPSAESGSRPRAAAPRCCVRSTLGAVE